MWRALCLAMGLGVTLAGCDAVSDLSGPPGNSVRLAGGVGLVAPQGYCVDPVTSRPAAGFALLAACAAMTADDTDAYPDDVALITVQVGGAASAVVTGQEEAFAAFLDTPEGAALLGVTGMGGPVSVVETDAAANAVRVYTRDDGPPGVVGSQAEAWRLFTDVKGRLVTIAVRGLTDAPLSQRQSRALLDQVAALLRGANTAAAIQS